MIFSGQQNNYAHLQNPYFNNAQIDSRKETSNSATLNQAHFGTATINGRKRNINDIKSDVLEIKNAIYGKSNNWAQNLKW